MCFKLRYAGMRFDEIMSGYVPLSRVELCDLCFVSSCHVKFSLAVSSRVEDFMLCYVEI